MHAKPYQEPVLCCDDSGRAEMRHEMSHENCTDALVLSPEQAERLHSGF